MIFSEPEKFLTLPVPGVEKILQLHYRGKWPDLPGKAIAIVGTRRASPYAKEAARSFARELWQSGFIVVSGLAYGVDAAAHEAVVEEKGITVAVLAHGLDRVYPTGNEALARRILAAGGCLVSEYPAGVPPHKGRFPERNRIIAALTVGTLVIEAPEKSGSLITARCALDYNRDVFVVPGPYQSDRFVGSHRLAQQGAKIVTSTRDILEEYESRFSSTTHHACQMKNFF